MFFSGKNRRCSELASCRRTLPEEPSRDARNGFAHLIGRTRAGINGASSALGLVSRASPVHTAMRNCTRDEGRPFEVGNQVLISSHRKLLWSKATVVNVAEKSEQDFDRYD